MDALEALEKNKRMNNLRYLVSLKFLNLDAENYCVCENHVGWKQFFWNVIAALQVRFSIELCKN